MSKHAIPTRTKLSSCTSNGLSRKLEQIPSSIEPGVNPENRLKYANELKRIPTGKSKNPGKIQAGNNELIYIFRTIFWVDSC